MEILLDNSQIMVREVAGTMVAYPSAVYNGMNCIFIIAILKRQQVVYSELRHKTD